MTRPQKFSLEGEGVGLVARVVRQGGHGLAAKPELQKGRFGRHVKSALARTSHATSLAGFAGLADKIVHGRRRGWRDLKSLHEVVGQT